VTNHTWRKNTFVGLPLECIWLIYGAGAIPGVIGTNMGKPEANAARTSGR
jgi:hypothetical protein